MALKILPCGDRAVLAEYGDRIDPGLAARVRAFGLALRQARHPGILQVVPGYRSTLVEYDPLTLDWDSLVHTLEGADAAAADLDLPPAAVIHFPVAYGGEFGADLEAVCAHTGLSAAEVIALHTAPAYLVYCMGFAAGFAYLGGLDPRLQTPRLPVPRTRVPAGSVGIGGEQTGIYPTALPGGWRLIGRTPLRCFDPQREPPTLLQAGDTLRFHAVSPEEFARIEKQVAAGVYQVERTQRL